MSSKNNELGISDVKNSYEVYNFFHSNSKLQDNLVVWMKKLQDDYDKRSSNSSMYFTVSIGKTYIKLIQNGSGHSVHAFVDSYGNIHKAASWNAPVKNIRYYLTDINNITVDWSGSYLYGGGSLPPLDASGVVVAQQPKYAKPLGKVVIMCNLGNGGREPYGNSSTGVLWYKSVENAVRDAKSISKLKGTDWSVEDAKVSSYRTMGRNYAKLDSLYGTVFETETPNVATSKSFIKPWYESTTKKNIQANNSVTPPSKATLNKANVDVNTVSARKTIVADVFKEVYSKKRDIDEGRKEISIF